MTTDMEQLKKLLDENEIDEKEYRHKLQQYAIEVLEQNKYQILNHLGSGSFGDVLLATSPDRNSNVAIKITRSDQTSENELNAWKIFKHPNVMPLLDIIELPHANIFIMPQMAQDLEDVLCSISRKPSGFSLVKSWLKDILYGLDYMHQNNFCHLDLKTENVMIDFQNQAVLCDFTFVSSTMEPIETCGAPKPMLPPEVWRAIDGHYGLVDGTSLDMWSFGIMAFNAFTSFSMFNKLSQLNCWMEDIYPLLFEDMQMDKFYALLTKVAFPGSSISHSDVKSALNFLHAILRVRPDQRPSAREALNHAFFTGTEILEVPEMVWIEKGFSYDLLSLDPPKTECKIVGETLDPSNEHPSRAVTEEVPEHDAISNCFLSKKSSHQSCDIEDELFTPDGIHSPEMVLLENSLRSKSVVNEDLVDDGTCSSDEISPCISFNAHHIASAEFSSNLPIPESVVKNSIADISHSNILQEFLPHNVGDGQSSKSVEPLEKIFVQEDIKVYSMSEIFNVYIPPLEFMPNEHQANFKVCERHIKDCSRPTKLLPGDLSQNVTNSASGVCGILKDTETKRTREAISESTRSSDTIKVPLNISSKQKSRWKRVRHWFNKKWTLFRTCGSRAAEN